MELCGAKLIWRIVGGCFRRNWSLRDNADGSRIGTRRVRTGKCALQLSLQVIVYLRCILYCREYSAWHHLICVDLIFSGFPFLPFSLSFLLFVSLGLLTHSLLSLSLLFLGCWSLSHTHSLFAVFVSSVPFPSFLLLFYWLFCWPLQSYSALQSHSLLYLILSSNGALTACCKCSLPPVLSPCRWRRFWFQSCLTIPSPTLFSSSFLYIFF